MSLDFLLEIGCEEIPHWMIPGALEQLSKTDLFGATPQVDATPRRLVVRASGLPERSPDETQVVKGPPASAGEKAVAGFAKKHGVDIAALERVGDYYELRKAVPGHLVRDALSGRLPDAILKIQWPKTMYWTGKNGPRFIRPIRWIVALLGNESGDEVIPFEIAGVKSGSITRGHRILGSASIPVTTANYKSELRRTFVILSSDERRKKIELETAALGAKPDPDLVETLTFITEYPTAIRGDFDPAYLELPPEVLTTVMRHHQKYFSVESEPGKLAPHFVAVMNTSGDPEGLVKKGNERVLKARFNDARFFWDVDQHKKLADRVADLDRVTFQAKIGSYLDKTNRVVKLAEKLGSKADAYVEAIAQAALISKCDLTTELVKEFTELQGKVGGRYARAQGETQEVCQAIYEHYKPIGPDDAIPSTKEGRIVALADKVDTLRECFRVGLLPTGSKDPFALRRAAQGVVRILIEGEFDFLLSELADDNAELVEFLRERVRHYFREQNGLPYDEVNAAMKAACEDLPDLKARLTALHDVVPTEHFKPLAGGFKRIKNILRQADFNDSGEVDQSLLEPGPESELYAKYEEIASSLRDAYFLTKDYKGALLAIGSIRPQIDLFFNKVLVNAKDEKVRVNRLTFLHNLLTEFSTIADFSEIVTAGDRP